MKNVLFLLLLVAAISACVSTGLDSSFEQQEGGDSVFVFKIDPADKIVFFFKGKEEDGVFIQNGAAIGTFYGKPKNGYIVFKAKPGDTLSLTQYAHKSSGHSNYTWPCEDLETISFDVQTNQVLYMADLKLGNKGEPFRLDIGQNFDLAKAHMREHFPKLAPNLKQGEFKLIKGERSCTETIYVPIFL